MPRSARKQASIDRYRTFRQVAKPKHGERAPVSWWLDATSREEFNQRAAAEQSRMAPNSGIAGDKGVTY